jgi:hypothetical protein
MALRRISEKRKEKLKQKTEDTQRMHQLFREIWDEREDEEGYCFCYETGQRMHGSTFRSNTCVYDHVLEKSQWPEYKFCKKNIIIVHPDVHTLKGINIDNVPKIKEYQEYLLSLHYQNKLEDYDSGLNDGILE